MLHHITVALHLLSVVAWVGGLFVITLLLPPALATQDAPERHAIWARLLPRVFTMSWTAAAVALASGFSLLFSLYGGFAVAGGHIHAMAALGLAMTATLAWSYIRPLKRFEEAEEAADASAAEQALHTVLGWQRATLVLGVVALITGGVGAYLGF